MERCADFLDKARELEEDLIEKRVRQVREAAKPDQEPDVEGNYMYRDCVDCGAEIDPERLKLGYMRCTSCVERIERRNKTFRRYW